MPETFHVAISSSDRALYQGEGESPLVFPAENIGPVGNEDTIDVTVEWKGEQEQIELTYSHSGVDNKENEGLEENIRPD